MAAVRCAARRLGGSLLQRTQAGSLMRPRQLSSKVSGEVAERPLLQPSSLMRSRQLSSDQARNIQKKEDDIWAEFNETLKRAKESPKIKKPNVFLETMMFLEGATKSLACGAFKVTVVYAAAAAVFSGNGLEA